MYVFVDYKYGSQVLEFGMELFEIICSENVYITPRQNIDFISTARINS